MKQEPGAPKPELPSVCGQHTYPELSARNKLARHRNRGDFSATMLWCRECGAWHVYHDGQR